MYVVLFYCPLCNYFRPKPSLLPSLKPSLVGHSQEERKKKAKPVESSQIDILNQLNYVVYCFPFAAVEFPLEKEEENIFSVRLEIIRSTLFRFCLRNFATFFGVIFVNCQASSASQNSPFGRRKGL